ncbi:hypothetical protein VTK73DRAFT_8219 [Phialemonium thermophilum]|uniref:Transmembrane protein n=1 Tax=Phialemonium thermophilum TaxID=223376 RepID=A0ABR3W9X2_9PEZI
MDASSLLAVFLVTVHLCASTVSARPVYSPPPHHSPYVEMPFGRVLEPPSPFPTPAKAARRRAADAEEASDGVVAGGTIAGISVGLLFLCACLVYFFVYALQQRRARLHRLQKQRVQKRAERRQRQLNEELALARERAAAGLPPPDHAAAVDRAARANMADDKPLFSGKGKGVAGDEDQTKSHRIGSPALGLPKVGRQAARQEAAASLRRDPPGRPHDEVFVVGAPEDDSDQSETEQAAEVVTTGPLNH